MISEISAVKNLDIKTRETFNTTTHSNTKDVSSLKAMEMTGGTHNTINVFKEPP